MMLPFRPIPCCILIVLLSLGIAFYFTLQDSLSGAYKSSRESTEKFEFDFSNNMYEINYFIYGIVRNFLIASTEKVLGFNLPECFEHLLVVYRVCQKLYWRRFRIRIWVRCSPSCSMIILVLHWNSPSSTPYSTSRCRCCSSLYRWSTRRRLPKDSSWPGGTLLPLWKLIYVKNNVCRYKLGQPAVYLLGQLTDESSSYAFRASFDRKDFLSAEAILRSRTMLSFSLLPIAVSDKLIKVYIFLNYHECSIVSDQKMKF